MEGTPKVTIVVRTKSREHLLARAIDDVLAQTHEAWQLVVVNDGGPAGPVDAVVEERRGALGDRVDVVHNSTSRGRWSASNQGLARATGEYIAIHDDDDTWASDFLEVTCAALDLDSERAAVVVATEIVIEEVGEDGSFVELGRHPFTPPEDIVTFYDLILVNRFVPIGTLARRSVLQQIGGFDESLAVVGDWEAHLRLTLHGEVSYMGGPPRAFWRQRPSSEGELSNSVHAQSHLHSRFDRIVRDRAVREYVKRHGVGGLMYVSKHIDETLAAAERRLGARIDESVAAAEQRLVERIDESRHAFHDGISVLHRQIDISVHHHVQYHSLGATLIRFFRRLSPRRQS